VSNKWSNAVSIFELQTSKLLISSPEKCYDLSSKLSC
jgi:hypothetical protein